MSPSVLDGFAVSLLLLVVVAGALLLPATAWEPAVAALAAVVAAIAAVLWALSSSLLPFSQQVFGGASVWQTDSKETPVNCFQDCSNQPNRACRQSAI